MNSKNIEADGVLSRIFSTPASAKILDFFLNYKDFDYSLAEVADKTGLSFRTAAREVPKLELNGLLVKHRRVAKATMYRLNSDLQEIDYLEKFVLGMSRFPSNVVEKESLHQELIDFSVNQEDDAYDPLFFKNS